MDDSIKEIKNMLIQAKLFDERKAGIPHRPIVSIKTPGDLARVIEHTALKPESTNADISKLCSEAAQFGFRGVCVNPIYVAQAKKVLQGSSVYVISVVGFPLGASLSRIKAEETKRAIEEGADEIDMVVQIGALKGHDYKQVYDDIAAVVAAARTAPVKTILEMGLLETKEKIAACLLAMSAGAKFVKTSTGFAYRKGPQGITPCGATVEDVRLMKVVVGENLGIKAAGGISNYAIAKALVEAGADRIGASASLAIIAI